MDTRETPRIRLRTLVSVALSPAVLAFQWPYFTLPWSPCLPTMFPGRLWVALLAYKDPQTQGHRRWRNVCFSNLASVSRQGREIFQYLRTHTLLCAIHVVCFYSGEFCVFCTARSFEMLNIYVFFFAWCHEER